MYNRQIAIIILQLSFIVASHLPYFILQITMKINRNKLPIPILSDTTYNIQHL